MKGRHGTWERVAETKTFAEATEILNQYRARGYTQPGEGSKHAQIKRGGLHRKMYVVRVRVLTTEEI